jgi:glycosyltransferase involved in cell wall biosynthesis
MDKNKSNYEVIVYHIGARDYYSVSEVFDRKKKLKFLITDYWFSKWKFLKVFKKNIDRRSNSNTSDERVKSYSLLKVLFVEFSKKIIQNKFNTWMFSSKLFTQFVIKKLKNKIQHDKKYVLWGYTGGNLEVQKEFKKSKNVFLIHNQIDPGLVYYEIEGLPDHKEKTAFLERITEEWQLADVILVNSEYSKKCLIQKNVNESKIIVVPLIYKSKKLLLNKEFNKKLNIAFIGNINKLKGFDTFLEVARKEHAKYNFIAVGNTHYDENYISEAKKYISFKGFLDRESLEKLYKNIDLLIFPTLCDGFGMVQLEAMSFGIPVISSSNCAKVVIDNVNGFIVNSADEIENRINYLDQNRQQLKELSKNCLNRINDFSEEIFLEKLNIGLSMFNIEIK